MEQTWGRVTVEGDGGQIQIVREALDVCVKLPAPLEELLRRDYRIEFHTPAEFRAKGYTIPGTDRVAWGYVAGPRTLWVNSRLGPWKAQYTTIHELGHAIDSDYLNPDKRARLMTMMVPAGHAWRLGSYPNRPREIYADAFVEAASTIESPLDDYYGDVPDPKLSDLLKITFEMAPAPEPEPEPPPDPVPGPDPALEAALAALAVAESKLKAILPKAQEIEALADG